MLMALLVVSQPLLGPEPTDISIEGVYWIGASVVYIVCVLVLVTPVTVWIWFRRNDRLKSRSRFCAVLVLFSIFVLLVISAFIASGFGSSFLIESGSEIMRRWLWLSFMLTGIGAIFYLPAAAIFSAIVLRRDQ